MTIKLKLFTISILCLISAACTSNIVQKEKVQTVNLHKLSQNISIELSGTSPDASKLSDLNAIQNALNDFDANNVLKNALEHNLLDKQAFSDNAVVSSAFDKNAKASSLIPVLTPSIIISADYTVVSVSLTAIGGANNKRVYSTQQTIGHGSLSENHQYAINNPIELKEKIVNALYNVAQQFADDYNKAQ